MRCKKQHHYSECREGAAKAARGRGFTLIELLIVIAIISLLAAIIFSVFAAARRDARQATTMSNLHQCGLALRMYADENDGDVGMPPAGVVGAALHSMPTCDPSDTWRQDCRQIFGDPLVGSFAYVRSDSSFATQDDWETFLQVKSNPTLLASIFYADQVPSPFHGDGPDTELCAQGLTPAPDRVIRLRLDGSVSVTHSANTTKNAPSCMTWSWIFQHDGESIKKG